MQQITPDNESTSVINSTVSPVSFPNNLTISYGKLESDYEESRQLLNEKFLSNPPISEDEMKILGIKESCKDKVRVFDSKDNLKLFHYIDSDPTDDVSHVKGVIVDTNTNKIVCMSMPHVPECLISNFDFSIIDNYENSMFMESPEGTFIRLFFSENSNSWKFSTHKNIDGENKRWGSPAFGTLFLQTVNACAPLNDSVEGDINNNSLVNILNKKYCYTFLVSHPYNNLVCKINQPRLFHMLTFDVENQKMTQSIINHPSVFYLNPLQFKNKEELVSYVNNLGWETVSGITVYTNKIVKLVNPEYYRKRLLRGNEANLRVRYFQLNEEERKELVDMYPYKDNFFRNIEKDKRNISFKLLELFIHRNINGNFMRVPKNIHEFLEDIFSKNRELRHKFISMEEKDKLREQIEKKFNSLTPLEMENMIKNMK